VPTLAESPKCAVFTWFSRVDARSGRPVRVCALETAGCHFGSFWQFSPPDRRRAEESWPDSLSPLWHISCNSCLGLRRNTSIQNRWPPRLTSFDRTTTASEYLTIPRHDLLFRSQTIFSTAVALCALDAPGSRAEDPLYSTIFLGADQCKSSLRVTIQTHFGRPDRLPREVSAPSNRSRE
jgi:hypothetical protein